MHLKKSELQIGEESTSGLSSDFNPTPLLSPTHPLKHLHFHTLNHSSKSTPPPPPPTQSQTPSLSSSHHQNRFQNEPIFENPSPNNTHVSIPHKRPVIAQTQLTSSSSSSSPRTLHQNQFRNEPVFENPSTNKTLVSIPHKKPIIAQPAPSTISYHHHRASAAMNSSESSHPSLRCSSSFAVALATRAIAVRLFSHFCCVRCVRVRLRFVIVLCLPSLYFFTSNHHRAFIIDFLSVIAFSAALLISLNLALPRLPSIRLFLSRSFPIKLISKKSAPESHPPVVWSIGSKPKSENRPNSGFWVQVYKNGDVYEGEFHKGKCSGSGVYYYHMSGKYEGDWVDEKYDGYGVETWAKGSRYRGQYRQGLRHGVGVYRFFAGDVYAGEWSNGQSHGCGIHTCEDGSRYVGEFKWGVKHGFGHYHFRNGDTYAGEYFGDKIHGFGVYRFGNGHRYEGAWHEGRRQGLGMYTFRNGESQSGHWQNGVLNVSTSQETLTGSSSTVNHAKVLNAVQEAQRAAEKAYEVAKVEERVNKAVAAANRAANAARVAAVKAVQNRIHHNNNDDVSWNTSV